MPVLVLMEWNGATPEKYEAVRRAVNWEGDVPAGSLFHAAATADDCIFVTDVWESEEAYTTFFEERVRPALRELGYRDTPWVEIHPIHAMFTPGFTPVERGAAAASDLTLVASSPASDADTLAAVS